MEATREEGGFVSKIQPPRLEDAGLEDCALPPDSIKEAFLKAATAVRSRAAAAALAPSEDSDELDCVSDPWPIFGESHDSLVGASPMPGHPGPCAVEKGGGLVDAPGDKLFADARNAEEKRDEVLEPDLPEGGGRACVEGLLGLKLEEKLNNEEEADDEAKGKESAKPTLVEAYF